LFPFCDLSHVAPQDIPLVLKPALRGHIFKHVPRSCRSRTSTICKNMTTLSSIRTV
jgi:hypothetical protein